ncbi:hypothetical protein [Streptomyces sp. SID12488]|uniref:hypothetical protein n=1 Tax=Streptomyces sp. SID12488 TaxID=2706040 RepID=UPI0013DCD231|nr:hypothetical protein [Streptomyces sp. SID12488]NEA65611.1 hypothetical protein [Streptomyces sp. SID12488]
MRRSGVAAAGVLAVALLAGCSASGSEPDGDDVAAAVSAEAEVSASAVASEGAGMGAVALPPERLEAVALADGDVVAGGTVTAEVSDRDFPNAGMVVAKKAVCTPLATVQAGSVLGAPVSVVRRMWIGPQEMSEADLGADPSDKELAAAALDATTSFVSLASYGQESAAKAVMAGIGRAVRECAGGFVYTVAGQDRVETVKVGKTGAPSGTGGADEVIAANLTVSVDGVSGPVRVVVVREGGTVGYFPATNLASQATGDAFTLPAALVQAQLAKLAGVG